MCDRSGLVSARARGQARERVCRFIPPPIVEFPPINLCTHLWGRICVIPSNRGQKCHLAFARPDACFLNSTQELRVNRAVEEMEYYRQKANICHKELATILNCHPVDRNYEWVFVRIKSILEDDKVKCLHKYSTAIRSQYNYGSDIIWQCEDCGYTWQTSEDIHDGDYNLGA